MDDIVGALFIFIIFILGPILEQMRKKQQGPRPPQRRPLPGPPPPQRTPQQQSRTETVTQVKQPVPQQRTEQTAADMLPDDLWEILTGQPKPRPTPAPPAPDVEDEEIGDEEAIVLEDVSVETTTRRGRFEEAMSLETIPRREDPVVVSMETVPDPRKRHAAFHDKIEHASPAAAVTGASRYFRTREEMRTGLIMQIILGPPKALE
jgi:hypothetical protein